MKPSPKRTALLPPRLGSGDRIGVVAPAGPVREEALERGLATLRGRGYEVVEGAHLRQRAGYLAGSDRDRLADFNMMIRDPRVRAVWYARGGYGSARIVEGLDFAALRRRPKALIGYSDATVLHAALWRRARLASYYAPNISEVGDPARYDARSLWGFLEGGEDAEIDLPLGKATVLRGGRAEGVLLGGCLSLLVSLVGTPWALPDAGAIFFWEEVGEEPYRIDRMLGHLRQSGSLARIAAMIVGQTVGCEAKDSANAVPLREIVRRHLEAARIPVLVGVPAGHGPGKLTLPLGRRVRLDANRGVLALSGR